MRTRVIADPEALHHLEPAWWDLFARVPDASPFTSPAWLLPWWQAFAPGELFVVVVTDGDRLVGLAPLYIENGAWGCRLLPLGIGVSDMLDILLDPAHAERAGAAIGHALRNLPDPVERWSAEEAPPEAAVLAMPVPEGWVSTVTPQSACPTLALTDSAGLRDAIPSRQWRKWQMARNRAARRTCAVTATTPATLDDDLSHLFRLHAARWRDRGEAGVLADPVVQRFHRAAAPALLGAGLLRLSTLWIDGGVAGVYYGLQRGRMAAAYLGGFDPAFAFESPGTLLIGAAIEAAVQGGVRAFNFLRGQESYKYAWGATDVWTQCRLFEKRR